MPQLDFFGESNRCRLSWSYSIDPLKPMDEGLFFVIVGGGKSYAQETALIGIPRNVAHEMVDDLLQRTWEAYLFGEPGDLRACLRQQRPIWRLESEHRPPI